MTVNISEEMLGKLKNIGEAPIGIDSVFVKNQDGTTVEKTMGSAGLYTSSEADGWQLRGPFPVAL